MGSSKKIAKGFFWTTFANVLNGIYGFISVPILIAFYGKANYGLIGLAISINVYLQLMDLGLNSTNVRYFSHWIAKSEKDKVNKLFQTSLSFYSVVGLINSVVLCVIALFSKQIFQLEVDQDVILKHLLYILAVSAFISWFSSCFDQFLRANEYVGWSQKIGLLPKCIQIVILVLAVTVGFSIELYYALTSLSLSVIIPIMIQKIKSVSPYIDFKIRFDVPTLKEILPYTLNIFSFGIFQFSIINLRPVFLGIEGTIESVADYRVLNGIVSVVIMLGGSFLGIILPSVSKAVAEGNSQAKSLVAYNGTKYITIVLAFCCFGVISVSKELLCLYVGQEYLYLEQWLILWLITTLATHNQAISSLILSGADIRFITYITIFSSIIGLVICWILIPSLQIGATVVAYGVYLLIQLAFYYFYYWPYNMGINSWKVFSKSFLPPIICGLASSVLVKLLFHQLIYIDNLWVCFFMAGFCFIVIFIPLIWLLVLSKEDKQYIYTIFRQ